MAPDPAEVENPAKTGPLPRKDAVEDRDLVDRYWTY
jgi:hypothetical protein